MSTLNFSAKDMKYNRKGEMSPRQQKRFLRGGRGRALLMAVLAGLFAGVLAQATRDQSVLTFYAAQVINAMGFGWATWTMNIGLFKDGAAGRVVTVTGRPELDGPPQRPVVYIGDQPITSDAAVAATLDPRKSYSAYIAPNSGRLLALEPKSKARPKPPPRPSRRKTTSRRTTSTTPRFGSRRRT